MIGDLLAAIKGIMESLNFRESPHVFSFDFIPGNILDRSFRVEVIAARNEEMTGAKLDVTPEVNIWTAHKMPVTGAKSRPQAYREAMNETETVENALYQSGIPNISCNGFESQDIIDGVLVVKYMITINYERSIE